MERTITVKGTGKVSVSPDLTVVLLRLTGTDMEYDKAVKINSEKLFSLQSSLGRIGFDKSCLKTTDYDVSTRYESVRDESGNYKSVFKGYSCTQGLKLEFDFDMQVLSKVISSVSSCISEPELNISFSVKDKDAVSESLLKSAAADAKKRAEILAEASGVKLGELISINYSWAEIDICSQTRFKMADACLANAGPEITPEDIRVEDSAFFVWDIE